MSFRRKLSRRCEFCGKRGHGTDWRSCPNVYRDVTGRGKPAREYGKELRRIERRDRIRRFFGR